MKVLLILLIPLLVGLSCSMRNNETSEKHFSDELVNVAGFDISQDDKTILMACKNRDGFSIYKMSIDSVHPELLIAGNKNLDFFNPVYSPDDKKIAFIGYFNKNINDAAIFTANSDGTNLRQLTLGKEIIDNVIFSDYDSSIVMYCLANTYGHSSPLGTDQPHGMDIYSINLYDTSRISKITELNDYGLYEISEWDSTRLLMYKQVYGMCSYDKKTKVLTRLEPSNRPRASADLYYTPVYSKKYNVMGVTAPFELYLMDMTNGNAKLIYRNETETGLSEVYHPCFFNNSKKILFEAEREGLLTVNFDGSDLRKIKIVLR